MEHIATIGFTDSGEQAHLIIRAGAGEVALAITLNEW